MKIIIFVLCVVLSVATGSHMEGTALSASRHDAENYINLNRQQHAANLEKYDTRVKQFRERYMGGLEVVNILSDMVSASIIQIQEHLDPLEVLSDSKRHCVRQYRHMIPGKTHTKEEIINCAIGAKDDIEHLLSDAVNIRNHLEQHYNEVFEKHVGTCLHKYGLSMENCTACIINVATETNAYAVGNKKAFESHMEIAECNAKAKLKMALDCSYNVQYRTTSKISEVDVQIQNCMDPSNQCMPCNNGPTCPHKLEVEAEHDKQYIPNPFYGHPGKECYMLNIKPNVH